MGLSFEGLARLTLILAVGCAWGITGQAAAVDAVRSALKSCGLKEGYDRKGRRLVQIGYAEREIRNPSSDPSFYKQRDALSKIAILTAKRDTLFALPVESKGVDTAVTETTKSGSRQVLMNVMKMFAECRMYGCKVLCSSESWDEVTGIYQVAVAVGWSEKSSRDAAQGALAMDEFTDCVTDDEQEWEQYFTKNDVSVMVGDRVFVGTDGKRRFLGIAAADVDGLSGVAMRLAMRNAQLYACGTLTFALKGDAVANQVAKRYCEEMEAGGVTVKHSWQSFVDEVVNRCRSQKIRAHEVYSKVVTHPLTGKSMYVAVYGVVAR